MAALAAVQGQVPAWALEWASEAVAPDLEPALVEEEQAAFQALAVEQVQEDPVELAPAGDGEAAGVALELEDQ